MAPLNYSKWDNLDLDSSDEEPHAEAAQAGPSSSTSAAAASSSSPSSSSRPLSRPDPPAHLSERNPSQQPGKVAAVFAPCIGERKGDLFLPMVIEDDHPIFNGEGHSSPVGELVGFEILVYRMEKRDYREIGVRQLS